MSQKQGGISSVPGSVSKVPQEHMELFLPPEAILPFLKSLGEIVDKSHIILAFLSETWPLKGTGAPFLSPFEHCCHQTPAVLMRFSLCLSAEPSHPLAHSECLKY